MRLCETTPELAIHLRTSVHKPSRALETKHSFELVNKDHTPTIALAHPGSDTPRALSTCSRPTPTTLVETYQPRQSSHRPRPLRS